MQPGKRMRESSFFHKLTERLRLEAPLGPSVLIPAQAELLAQDHAVPWGNPASTRGHPAGSHASELPWLPKEQGDIPGLAALNCRWSSSCCWKQPKEQGPNLLSPSAARGQPGRAGPARPRHCAQPRDSRSGQKRGLGIQ